MGFLTTSSRRKHNNIIMIINVTCNGWFYKTVKLVVLYISLDLEMRSLSTEFNAVLFPIASKILKAHPTFKNRTF